MKKATTKDDIVADTCRDAEIAMIMGMGSATAEEAARALDENNGNVDRALAQLYGMKDASLPQYKTGRTKTKTSIIHQHEDTDDVGAASKPQVAKPKYYSPSSYQSTSARAERPGQLSVVSVCFICMESL